MKASKSMNKSIRIKAKPVKAKFLSKMQHNEFKDSLSLEIGESVKKALQNIYAPLLTIKTISERISDNNKAMFQNIRNLSAQIERVSKELSVNMQPLFEMLQKVQEEYNIAEKDAVRCMEKYKWFISPNMPPSLIYEVYKLSFKKGNQLKAVNLLFEEYLFANNFQGLDDLVEDWNGRLDSRRYKIIKDVFFVIKRADKNINITNVVLPALIVQAEGILKDRINFWTWNNKKNGYREIKEAYKSFKSNILRKELQDLGDRIILDYLFQNSYVGIPLQNPFQFNRHKILHGEARNYGKKNYLVRIIMVIDYLIGLS